MQPVAVVGEHLATGAGGGNSSSTGGDGDGEGEDGGGGVGAAGIGWFDGRTFPIVAAVLDPTATSIATPPPGSTSTGTAANANTGSMGTGMDTDAGDGASKDGHRHQSELAYVMFTSGSTGHPKAVLGSHRAILHRFKWMEETFPIAPDAVCCQTKSIAFVDFLWDAFGPLTAGATLTVVPKTHRADIALFAEFLEVSRCTRVTVVPSVLAALLDVFGPSVSEKFQALRMLTCSGELLYASTAATFAAALPGCLLLNLYGLTEVAADATFAVLHDPTSGPGTKVPTETGSVPRGGGGDDEGARSTLSTPAPAPVGQAIAGCEVLILHPETLQEQPPGAVGELVIVGPILADGYHGDPHETAAKFMWIRRQTRGGPIERCFLQRWKFDTGGAVNKAPVDDGASVYIGSTSFPEAEREAAKGMPKAPTKAVAVTSDASERATLANGRDKGGARGDDVCEEGGKGGGEGAVNVPGGSILGKEWVRGFRTGDLGVRVATTARAQTESDQESQRGGNTAGTPPRANATSRTDAGVLYLRGRADTQVNLNGNRLNLMEIEGHLRLAPRIRNAAVVVAARVTGGREQLMALVEPETAVVADIRAHLHSALPTHMIPASMPQIITARHFVKMAAKIVRLEMCFASQPASRMENTSRIQT